MTRSEHIGPELVQSALRSAQTVGTPFWLYDAEAIRGRVKQLAGFDTVRFAQKANSNTHILRLLREAGAMVDAVSLGEIERALLAGYVPGTAAHEIVFTADVIDHATLKRVVALNIPVNCGSLDMITQVGQASPGHDVWLRINPGFGHGHSRKTNTGGPLSKHGIWHEELVEALKLVDQHGLHLVGLHMHIGSGVDYGHLRQVCTSMVDLVRQGNHSLDAISAGGGLSTPYRATDTEIDTAEYFAIWDAARREIETIVGNPVKLEIEPGRYLVANAGLLVAEVRAVKRVADKHFVLLDAGFSDLARPAMYGSYHEIGFMTPEGQPVTGPLQPAAIGGPLCESGDVFTQLDGGDVEFRSIALPKVGDLAIFRDAGAYGASMSSNYNSRPLAAEVMLDNGDLSIIRNRQRIEDLLDLEIRGQLGRI
ncbi:diaminopimelate decarboxylase [Devosia sp.]|uniref:diaminopimelate decarboxylase n=1 Tax=Devosia sp. TaxID=1871048 RepID=UPI003266D4E2